MHVHTQVTDCPPNVKGNTASGAGSKAATLETGAIITVPSFIESGQKIKVRARGKDGGGSRWGRECGGGFG
jgi:elongation factor P